ncbi:MAG: hypothetical protein HN757_12745, partial [Calditrichaeota bacterium]|nr:hypothetical protein [Calditrichota bacterium]
MQKATDFDGLFEFKPLEPGFGLTVGNALRRVLLSDILCVVFDTDNDNINISKNTTRFHNEILKQRLGCIPVHIKDTEGIENLVIELNINNTS